MTWRNGPLPLRKTNREDRRMRPMYHFCAVSHVGTASAIFLTQFENEA